MKTIASGFLAALLLAAVVTLTPLAARAQSTLGTGDAQRNSLRTLRFQLDALKSAARTAPAYYNGTGYDMLQSHFQQARSAYTTFRGTLTAAQVSSRENDFAELDAGLDIIAEAFTNYQNEAASGYSGAAAFRDLCQTVSRAMTVWSQQLITVCSRARVAMY